jgi:ribonuclease-3
VSKTASLKQNDMPAPLEDLEHRIGHKFDRRELLQRALTHKSLPNETLPSSETPEHNEPFEFLGDAILGYLTSDYLFRYCPGAPEGRLSMLKNHLVSSAHLHEIALSLGVGEFLHLGKGEELSGGRKKPTLLANGIEALIAAVYLDGGIEAARRFVEGKVLQPASIEEIEAAATPLNAKSTLLELAHSRKLPLPRYVVVQEIGPQHAKLYTVEARLGADITGKGEGSTLKQASQRAAQQVLDALKSELPEEPGPGVEAGGIDA